MASYPDDGTRAGLTHHGNRPAAGKLQRNLTPENPRPIASESAAPVSGRQQLGDVLERVSDALVALDRDWRYTYVNRQAAKLFGRLPEDLLGHHIWTLFPEGVGQPFQLAYQRAMAEQVFIQIETYYEPWDRWFENRIYPSPDGVSIFFHEITDRKRAEQAAHENAALLEAQNQALQSIARGEPLERTLDLLLRAIEAQCPGMLSSVLVLDADKGRIRHAAAPNLPALFLSAIEGDPGSPPAARFAIAGMRAESIVVEDVTTDPLWEDCRDVAIEHGIRAACSSPILDAHGGVLGCLIVYFRSPGRPSDRHQRLIETATHTAAIALANRSEAEARRVSDERFRMAVTGGNVGIWEWDVVKDQFLLSDQLRGMFEWPIQTGTFTLEEVIRSIHREDRARVEHALGRSVLYGEDYDIEYRVVGPGGAVHWIATKGGGEYDESSTLVRMMGVALDITKRKETEIELRRSEERFQLVARATNDAIWDWDLKRDVIWWNQGISTLFGYSPAEAGREATWRAAQIHPDDLNSVTSAMQAVAHRGEQFWSGEFRFRRSNGSYADVFDRGYLIYDAAGTPIRMIGAMTDISDRKRAVERLEAAVDARTAELHAKNTELEGEIAQRQRVAEQLRSRNDELKSFAYTVSHDLKAPLRGIGGYARELSRRHRDGLTERGAFCVEQILTATRNLDRLIEDLLHYSRLDGDTPTPIDVDLAACAGYPPRLQFRDSRDTRRGERRIRSVTRIGVGARARTGDDQPDRQRL